MNTTFLDVSVAQFQIFLLVFVRIIGLLAVAPVFGHQAVPTQFKAGFSLLLAIVLYPAIPITLSATTDLIPYVILVVRELIMGMILGFFARFIFFAVQFCGEVIGIDIGFSVVNIIDPVSSQQVSVIGTFQNLLALVIFLTINGHYAILQALAASFRMVPLGGVQLTPMLGTSIIALAGGVFLMAIKLVAPILSALFLTSLALGILARTVPQMNVFVVGFPLKIGVGIGMILITLPLFGAVLIKFFGTMSTGFSILLQQMYKP